MPFYRRCLGCTDDLGNRPEFGDLTDALAHARIEHPKSDPGKIIETKFETQVEAQGRAARRMGQCRSCGAHWETTAANPSGLCENCEGAVADAH